jgi:hypothetical protein
MLFKKHKLFFIIIRFSSLNVINIYSFLGNENEKLKNKYKEQGNENKKLRNEN